MRTAAIVKVEIPADRVPGITDSFVGSQIDLLVFDALPQPLVLSRFPGPTQSTLLVRSTHSPNVAFDTQ